jgi:hypothetical protein
MRGTLAATAAFLLAQSLASACCAQAGGTTTPDVAPADGNSPPFVEMGRISYLDAATMYFVCQGPAGAGRYWVTRATRFGPGVHQSSFYNLRTGQNVEVQFHNSGRFEIADRVTLLP